jgi:hypothetical protein
MTTFDQPAESDLDPVFAEVAADVQAAFLGGKIAECCARMGDPLAAER